MRTPGCCWLRSSPGGLTSRSVTASSLNPAGNPPPPLSCPLGERGESRPAGLGGAGRPGGAGQLALAGRIEQSFLRRIERLPELTQRLMLVAAAEPVGDPAEHRRDD